jgi:hypothetical protein
MSSKLLPKLVLAAAGAALVAASALPAQARVHGHVLSMQGRYGHGFVQSRSVSRQPGSGSTTRSLQTDSGRGYVSSRNAQWGDGSYSGGRTTTLNNGTSFGHTTTATANGDGTANYTTTFTRPDGDTGTISGTTRR